MSGPRHLYSVYGSVLASSIEFPELREIASGAPRWTFEAVESLPAPDAPRLLGSDPLYADVAARLYACADGHRIEVDDTGTFALSANGRAIRWTAGGNAWPDFVRAHLLGRVLATAFHLDGFLPLHGSAVMTTAGVVAFLAPKGFGKSTLAYACTAAGARLVTDDALPVEPGRAPMAWPGVHGLRLRDDVLATVGESTSALSTREGKHILADWDPARVVNEPAPLAALYLLDPVAADAEAPARVPLPAMLAAISVVAHAKIGRMLGPDAAASILSRAAAIAAAVPVMRLHAPRDLARLPATVQALSEWHGGFA